MINQQRRNLLGQHPNRRHEIIRSTSQSPVPCTYTYPKLCTDHPVLVYKTYEFERTVLRLFSCLPPQSWIPSPPLWSPSSQSPFLLYPSSCSTSPLCSFGSITSNSKPSLTLTAIKVVSPRHPDNAESHPRGSFNFDREKGDFSHEWASLAEFDRWRQEEEHVYSIEFIASSTQARGKHWSRCQLFVCGRKRSGGYVKQHPGRENKIGTRKSGCCCEILIKQYPHTSTILGRYVAEHNHEVGFANIAYLCLSTLPGSKSKQCLCKKLSIMRL